MNADSSKTQSPSSAADSDCCKQPASGSCCEPVPTQVDADDVRATVRAGYAEIAKSGQWSSVAPDGAMATGSCCGPAEPSSGGGCCGPTTLTATDVALAVGYSASELATLPSGANMGLSCGNPTALASLKPGEVVLDLGAGGGFDCFLAGPRVGATGRVIGVDMTAEMLGRARGNLAHYRKASGLDNVEFRLGEIEHLPVADASVDVVISNCVLNLSPDKPQAWREIARVLKPGGRAAVSDLVLLRPLPAGLGADIDALIGCVAGAPLLDDVRSMMAAAGLADASVVTKPEYVAAFENAQDPLYARIAKALPEGLAISDFITSADITALKPTA